MTQTEQHPSFSFLMWNGKINHMEMSGAATEIDDCVEINSIGIIWNDSP